MKKNLPFAGLGCLVLLLVVATPTVVRSQTSLPPAAQEALDNGIIAAKVPDYVLAIRYFEEARKIAPEAPIIYFNLGLAESKIPGRELRAICWFAAYLAAEPQSANAASVKEQIQILKVKSQSNILRLIKMLQDAPPQGDSAVEGVAELLADSGDVPTALKTALSIQSEIYQGSAQGGIAETQAKTGDFQEALKTAEIVKNHDYRRRAFLRLAVVKLENGDLTGFETAIAGARRAADLIQGARDKSMALKELAEIQIKAGNKAGAQSTLKAAVAATDSIEMPTDPEYRDTIIILKTQAQAFIANVQISAGDIEGAKQTLLMAFKNSELIRNNHERTYYQEFSILEYQAKAGDISNAMKTYKSALKLIPQESDPAQRQNFIEGMKYRQGMIAEAQAKAGDFAGAVKMANEITDQEHKFWTLGHIVEIQAEARDFDGATKTVEMLPDDYRFKDLRKRKIAEERAKPNSPPASAPTPRPIVPKPPPPPLTAKEWIQKINGLDSNFFLDLPAYLKTLPADDASKMFNELKQSVSTIVARQNDITDALRRKPIEQPKP